MTQHFHLTIPKASPSLNTVTGKHWIRYWRAKRLWERLIWIAKVQAQIYADPLLEHATVTITRYGKRLLDDDNLVGGAKPLVDSLKALRLIVDDSPRHIALTVFQFQSTQEQTDIHITEVDAERLERIAECPQRIRVASESVPQFSKSNTAISGE